MTSATVGSVIESADSASSTPPLTDLLSLDISTVKRTFAIVLGCWLLGYLGFSSLWIILFGLLILFSHTRQRKHRHFHQSLQFQRLMHNPQLLQRTLPLIPAWISFPDLERVDFIQAILRQMWPSISQATETEVIRAVTPLFEKFRPGFLTGLGFEKFDLGPTPPDVLGVRLQPQNEPNEIMLDIEVEFTGHPNIEVEAKSGPASVSTHVEDVFFRATIRVLIKPLISQIPCFGAISISTVSKPEINFKLSTVGVSVMAIPGLNDFLYGLIKNQLANFLVWPRKIVVPINKNLSPDVLASLARTAEAQGVLTVRIIGAKDIKSSDCYIKCVVGTVSKKTETKHSNGGLMEFTENEFQFSVSDPHSEEVTFTVKARDNIVMGTVNTLVLNHVRSNKSTEIGSAKFPINRLVDQGGSDNGGGGGGDSNNTIECWLTVNNVKHKKQTGQIHVILDWNPYRDAAASTDSVGDNVGGNDKESKLVQTNSQSLLRARKQSSKNIIRRGLLLLTIHRCDGLHRPNGHAPHHAYVRLSIGAHKNKTHSHRGSEIVINESFEIPIEDICTQSLYLEVIDKPAFQSFGLVTHDEKLGDLVIELERLLTKETKNESLALNHTQAGTITVSLKLREQSD